MFTDYKKLEIGTVLKCSFDAVAAPYSIENIESHIQSVSEVDDWIEKDRQERAQTRWGCFKSSIGFGEKPSLSLGSLIDYDAKREAHVRNEYQLSRGDLWDNFLDMDSSLDLNGQELVLLEAPVLSINGDMYTTERLSMLVGLLNDDRSWSKGAPQLRLTFSSSSASNNATPLPDIVKGENDAPVVLQEERHFS